MTESPALPIAVRAYAVPETGEEEPDSANGYMFVRITGTAGGTVFGSYTLEIQKDGDPLIAGVVVYPGGGAEPARELPRHLIRPRADEVNPEHDDG